jgi:predicted metal-dependent phosphoesterase TrpH
VGVRIDLHTHSTESDGTDTPSGLVAVAIEAGLDVVAVTDHDTTAGWAEAERAVREGPHTGKLRLVRGAELSCTSPDGAGRDITVHLLAYFFDPRSPALVREQTRLREDRRLRLREMADRMVEDGFPVDPDELMARLPPDAPAGRPHLGRMLMRAGMVDSIQEAFTRYLGSGGKYYVPRTHTPIRRAIEMIGEAGGVTVMAHPFASARGPIVDTAVIADLAGHGLRGIEVDHPDHHAASRAELRALAADLDLIPTGSSDYHGTNKPIAIGQETTPPESLDRLLDSCPGAELIA